jgi:hypothetical protein
VGEAITSFSPLPIWDSMAVTNDTPRRKGFISYGSKVTLTDAVTEWTEKIPFGRDNKVTATGPLSVKCSGGCLCRILLTDDIRPEMA